MLAERRPFQLEVFVCQCSRTTDEQFVRQCTQEGHNGPISLPRVIQFKPERLAYFRVLHKHPGIRRCGSIALKQNDLVGGRVKHASGVCEGLSHHWGLNQTIQSGYAYVKKIHIQDIYHLPVKLKTKASRSKWWIPGVLSNRARLEVTLTMPTQYEFHIIFVDSLEAYGAAERFKNMADNRRGLFLTFSTYSGKVAIKTKVNGSVSELRTDSIFPQIYKSNVVTKFLFLTTTLSEFMIFVDGYRVMYFDLGLKNMRQIIVEKTDKNEASTNQLLVHGFEFTE